MKVLVSACLLGENCKYNGSNNYSPAVAVFLKYKEVLPVCPEMMAGISDQFLPVMVATDILKEKGACEMNMPYALRGHLRLSCVIRTLIEIN